MKIKRFRSVVIGSFALLFALSGNLHACPVLEAYWSLNVTSSSNAGKASAFNSYAADGGNQQGSAQLNVEDGSSDNQFQVGTSYGTSVNADDGISSGSGFRLRQRVAGYRINLSGLDFSTLENISLTMALNSAAGDGFYYTLDYNLNNGGGWQTAIASQQYITSGWETITNDLSGLQALEGQSNVNLRIALDSVAKGQEVALDNISIFAEINCAPEVSAGPDQNVVLPAAQASLAASVVDDGLPEIPGAYTLVWSQVSGPGTASFSDTSIENPSVSFDLEGIYVLQLLADDGELSASDTLTITVEGIDAGADQTIRLPSSAILTPTVPNSGATFAWAQISGSGTATFIDPSSSSTAVSFDASGTYVLELTAESGASSVSDTLTVTVSEPDVGVSNLFAFWSLNVTNDGHAGEVGPFNPMTPDSGEQTGAAVLNVKSDSQIHTGTNYGSSVNALNGFGAGAGLRIRDRADRNGVFVTMSSLDFTNWSALELSYALRASSSDEYSHVIQYDLNDGNGWQTAVTDQSYITSGWEVITHDLSALTLLDGQSNVSFRLLITSVREDQARLDNFQINGTKWPSPFNRPPSVSLTSPEAGLSLTLGLPVSFIADVFDTSAIDQVAFYADDRLLGVDRDSSDGWALNWVTDVAGVFDLTAYALDVFGLSSSSAPVEVTIFAENLPPSVNITAPSGGETFVTETGVTVSADASDDHGVQSVEFFANGVSLGVDNDGNDGWAVIWNPNIAGSVALTATATDSVGGVNTSNPVDVSVIAIQRSVPTASFVIDKVQGKSPLTVIFDASQSSDLGGNNGGIATYHWDLDGDGFVDISTSSPILEYVYSNNGTFEPNLTVEDIDGDTAAFIYDGVIIVERGVRVGYAAPSKESQFAALFELSDGTILVGGAATDLSWLPEGTPTSLAVNPGNALSSSENRIAYLMRMSADLDEVLHVWHLPAGAAENIQRIRSTNIPGEATGVIYISGLIDNGYFIGRLNDNFVNGTPSGLEWVVPINTSDSHTEAQAWDVSSDETLIYQNGSGGGVRVDFLDASGNPIVLPQLRATHWVGGESEKGLGVDFPTATASTIQFYGDLQSWTEADRTTILPDGNGEKKMGMWPFDIFLIDKLDGSGPVRTISANGKSYGYNGYRNAGTPVLRSIVIDRRNGDFYLGFNSKSKFWDQMNNKEQPDFEPGVIGYDKDGAQKWWSRLYTEWFDENDDDIVDWGSTPDDLFGRETRISWPDQYVGSLEIDYSMSYGSGSTLVVNARCHGNAPSNFWSGDEVSARPDYRGFQTRFTGTEGNIHITWVGKLDLTDGTLRAATYNAGLWRRGEGNWPTDVNTDPNLDGWYNHNAGWPELTTTRTTENSMRVDSAGRVYIIGRGPRMITTRDAWQKIPKRLGGANPILNEGNAPWHQYIRVFDSDLSSLNYSTALTGEWDYPDDDINQDPINADNTQLLGVLPLNDGVIVTGYQQESGSNLQATKGNMVPVNDVPSWATETAIGRTALFGRFPLTEPARFEGYTQNYRDFAFSGHPLGTHGSHTALDFDANEDGSPNILDFAFLARTTDLADVARKQPLADVWATNGNQYFSLDWFRHPGGIGDPLSASGYQVGDLVYFVEISSGLESDNWLPAENYFNSVPAQQFVEDGAERVVHQAMESLNNFDSPDEVFTRVRVEDASNP